MMALRAYRALLLVVTALWLGNEGAAVSWSNFIKNNPKTCPGTATAACVIPANQSVEISAVDVTVRSLTVYGTLIITPTKANPKVVVDSAFIVASGNQAFINITAPSWAETVKIYLRRNPAAYKDVPQIAQSDLFTGGRVFGGANGARILVQGAPLKRTYTLLAKSVYAPCGSSSCTHSSPVSIFVVDDVSQDWKAGDDIVISPSDQQYGVWPFYLAIRPGAYQGKIVKIVSVGDGTTRIDLDSPIPFFNFAAENPPGNHGQVPPANYPMSVYPVFYGDRSLGIQSEVFILDRNILFTGDDFSARWEPLRQPPWQNPLNTNPANNGWPTPWSPWANSTFPGEGLHTIIAGYECEQLSPCQSGGGWMKMRYARVEKAGQRGWIGRYPLHFHRMGDCPDCEFTGNVVYNTQQRGITIHSTGRSVVQDNIVYNQKGAGIYVEEGTEIANTIQRNIVVCGNGVVSYSAWNTTIKNWQIAAESLEPGVSSGGGACQLDSTQDFGDPSIRLGGCRITGTDNEQADCVQQAGIWALSATNNFIGNRLSNHYNCIYFQSTRFSDGRLGTDSLNRICPLHSNWGIIKDNVCHSHQRFGFYPDVNYPRKVNRSIATNGYVADLVSQPLCMSNLTDQATWCSCRANTLDGEDNAQNITYIENQLDWGNAFVGQYDLADVQYLGYRGILNNIQLYWKGSKTMKDQKSAHVKNSTFYYDITSIPRLAPWSGNTATYYLNTPGISGTIILEDIVFKGDANVAGWILDGDPKGASGGALGINQQCKGYLSGVAEGGICTPQIVLKNVDFSQLKDFGNVNASLPQDQRPTWIKFGAESGNPFLGMVVAFDDSLCGGFLKPCPYRSILPKYSTHLLDLPGHPCNATLAPYVRPSISPLGFLPLNSSGDWSRRFYNGIICSVQTRRLTIWGKAQNSSFVPVDLILIPPGKQQSQGFHMSWTAFNRAYDDKQGTCPWAGLPCCMGTECAASEPRRFAEGYGAAIIPHEYFAATNPWEIVRADGKPVDTSKITMVEFSDMAFDGNILPGPDTVHIKMNNVLCTLTSTTSRPFMTQYGPTTRLAGGSCVREWLDPQLTQVHPTPTRYPTRFPTKTKSKNG